MTILDRLLGRLGKAPRTENEKIVVNKSRDNLYLEQYEIKGVDYDYRDLDFSYIDLTKIYKHFHI